MLKAYRDHVAERAALGIPPLPLDAKQVAELIELIKNPPWVKTSSCWIC
jgi:aconitate hydratase 2/2-methylisocitrate dehydratase